MQYLTITEFIEHLANRGVSISRNNVQILLRADRDKQPKDRRLPGAYHTNPTNPARGEWLIPLKAAERFQKDTRGRKPAVPEPPEL